MAISDLTGTTWVFNDSISAGVAGSDYWYINIEIDAHSSSPFDCMRWHFGEYLELGSLQQTVYYNGWINTNYKTWTITGGTDATNSTLIAWFEANATQIEPEPPTPTTVQNLYFGSAKMVDSYWGASKIAQIYYGNTLVWENTPPTPASYTVTVTNMLSIDNVVLYDGQDNTGTLLGTLLSTETDTYTITSGHIYVEWDDPYTPGSITFSNSGTIVGNPATISGDGTLDVAIPVTFVMDFFAMGMHGQTLKIKTNGSPGSENDYDYIVVTTNSSTPTTNTLPSGAIPITSVLRMWCTNYDSGMKAAGYGWNSGANVDVKGINATTYNNSLPVIFTETLNGYSFNNTIYLRMQFNDMIG